MLKYKHIFFDLDKTLWDFDTDSKEVLLRIYNNYKLETTCISSFEWFYSKFKAMNVMLWNNYRNGTTDKSKLSVDRFLLTFQDAGIDDFNLSAKLSDEYNSMISATTTLFPGAKEILAYLSEKYLIHVITNGFSETQFNKLRQTGLNKYFNQVITSEEVGKLKPSSEIFRYAFSKTDALPKESLMIGDDPEVDLIGALNVGMDQLFVNHTNIKSQYSFTYEVKNLLEIANYL